ncbi:MAG: tetratricopeptide repeat protein [Rhizobiaceae bacterium]|nr:MAG: tetratricopeptide repeat protein [Rhizobiaceae bacterium]
MTIHDSLGLPLGGATAASLDAYERAVGGFQRFGGDPLASADAAIAAAPGFVMAHVLKGYLYALSTEPRAAKVARDIHAAAKVFSVTPRETAHVEALGELASGNWNRAGAILRAISKEHPLDTLALQAGHQVDYFTGNTASLRDRIAAALPAWDKSMPGYHSTLGMHAFGLEENGDYAAAEAAGRQAVALEPRNGWAQHAVAHVMEMQSRQKEGIQWMRANPDAWSRDNFLQVHNWWHLSIFHYDLSEVDAVLALYDGPIYGSRSKLALNMVDASAILWRLFLGCVDVGDRWGPLAQNWLPFATAGNYAFNDVHAMMAFIGAGKWDAARSLLDAQEEALRGNDDNAGFTRIGHPFAKGLYAFGRGDYAQAVRLLESISAIASRFGGSHVQRDVINLTLIEAAIRSGDREKARALTAGRLMSHPDSPLSRLFSARAQALSIRE